MSKKPAGRLSQWFSSLAAGAGMLVIADNAALAQDPGTAPPPPPPHSDDAAPGRLSRMFNNSEVTQTGWALPLATLGTNTTLRTEVGYGDATPGLYVNHKFQEGMGQADLGFMNFSLNVFPLGDTLSFNSKGDLYSNGDQTGDQLGLRYRNTLELSEHSRLEYAGFAGWSVKTGQPDAGVNADYHYDIGQWNLLAGAGVAWLGERGGVSLDAIGAATRHFTFQHLPDGKLTLGLELRDATGKDGLAKATAFGEYQTHLVKDGDGPAWMHKISALFGAYAGTESYGGKAGLLYSPGKMHGGKDFGVSFGPSVGWDSKERGPQFNLELRAGF